MQYTIAVFGETENGQYGYFDLILTCTAETEKDALYYAQKLADDSTYVQVAYNGEVIFEA